MLFCFILYSAVDVISILIFQTSNIYRILHELLFCIIFLSNVFMNKRERNDIFLEEFIKISTNVRLFYYMISIKENSKTNIELLKLQYKDGILL